MTDNVRALATRQAAPVAMRTDNLDTLTVAKMLAESGFFGEVRDAGKALAKILAGQELGMGPIASLMGVYYQQGKVTYSANIMAAAVKKTGQYTYRVKKIGTGECAIEFFERSGGAWETLGLSEFTIQDASDAGLTTGPNKHNWKNYPRNMLFSRAMSNGVKWFVPDIFGGVTPYTPDELGSEVVMNDNGDMRPVIADAPTADIEPIRGEVVDAPPSTAWPEPHESRWAAGVTMAQEIGAEIPNKPPAGKAGIEALQTLGTNIKARQALIATLQDLVRISQESGNDSYEVPEAITTWTDSDIRETIAMAQQSIDMAGVMEAAGVPA